MIDFDSVEIINIENLSEEEILEKANSYDKSTDNKLILFLPYKAQAELNFSDTYKTIRFYTEIDNGEDMEYFLNNISELNTRYPELTIEVKNYITLNNLNISEKFIEKN